MQKELSFVQWYDKYEEEIAHLSSLEKAHAYEDYLQSHADAI